MTKQEGGKLLSKFARWMLPWIWAFQVSGPPQLLRVSLTIVYTCQDTLLESLKMAFFIVMLDSKYSKMTPKFVKQKSNWLHSSIKFANPVCLWTLVFWPSCPRWGDRRKFTCTKILGETEKRFQLVWLVRETAWWQSPRAQNNGQRDASHDDRPNIF